VRWAGDAARLPSLGMHLRRHRQDRPGQRPQGTRRRHLDEPTTHTATLRVGRVAIVCAARVVPTLPATPAPALTQLRSGRLPVLRKVGPRRRHPGSKGLDVDGLGLRMVGVAPTLVLRVVMGRLATS
jgi:hypothetical protein